MGDDVDAPTGVMRSICAVLGGEATEDEVAFFESVAAGRVHNARGARIRPSFFRELLVRCGDIPDAALGVGIKNCVIDGTLNIKGLQFGRLLSITGSRIEGDFIFNHADLKALFLDGTHVRKVQGVRANVTASIYLRSELLPSKHANEEGYDDLPAAGSAPTVRRFVATNGVDISGAKVAGALSARGARILVETAKDGGDGKEILGLGLNLADSDISSIILGPKDNQERNELQEEAPLEHYHRGQTGGEASARRIEVNACEIHGGVSFQRARCKSFTDSNAAYSDLLGPGARKGAQLVLRGFHYESLGRKAIHDLQTRRIWLGRDAERDDEDFDPQPYEQLAAVLKSHGRERDAHEILIDKERRLTPLFNLRRPDWNKFFLIFWPFYILWGMIKRVLLEMIGFGYKPAFVLLPMFALFIAASLFFNGAFASGYISPVNPAVSGTTAWIECHQDKIEETDFGHRIYPTNPILSCKQASKEQVLTKGAPELSNYPDFNGYWYSLDALLPIISLRQEEFWVPVPGWVRSITHLVTLLGWIFSSLAIAGTLSYLNRSSR